MSDQLDRQRVPSHPNIVITRLAPDRVPDHLDDKDTAEISAGTTWAVTIGLVHADTGAVIYTSDPDSCYLGEPGCAGTYPDPRAIPGALGTYAADVWTDAIDPYDSEFIGPHGLRVLVTDMDILDDEKSWTGYVFAKIRRGVDVYDDTAYLYHLTDLRDEEAR